MHRAIASISIATASLLGSAGCATVLTRDQSSEGPLVGAWIAEVSLLDCASGQATQAPPFRALVVFHSGGTLSEVSGPSVRRTPSFGTWSRSGANEYTATSMLLTYDANGAASGAQEIRRTIRLSPDSTRFVAETRTVATDPSGSIAFQGCARGNARRAG